jgi:L-ascorbate metabolism protein UlaG (beta-lactamase superfamily)
VLFRSVTNIRDWEGGGTLYHGNSIFVFEIGELCIGHLGHLHHTLEPAHLRALGRLDVVLAPVDGGSTLDRAGMLDVLRTLQTRLIIPMHYFGPTTLQRFLDGIAGVFPVERRTSPELVISKATLPARPTVVVLPGPH